MKTSYRSRFITALTVSVGLLTVLLAGGCAAEVDEPDAGNAPADVTEGVEGSTEAGVAADASDLHIASHPAGCRCGICTGGRHTHEAR